MGRGGARRGREEDILGVISGGGFVFWVFGGGNCRINSSTLGLTKKILLFIASSVED